MNSRVGRCHEGRHRVDFFCRRFRIVIEQEQFVAPRIDSHRYSIRQDKEFTARRQGDKILFFRPYKKLSATAGHFEIGKILYNSVAICKDQ